MFLVSCISLKAECTHKQWNVYINDAENHSHVMINGPFTHLIFGVFIDLKHVSWQFVCLQALAINIQWKMDVSKYTSLYSYMSMPLLSLKHATHHCWSALSHLLVMYLLLGQLVCYCIAVFSSCVLLLLLLTSISVSPLYGYDHLNMNLDIRAEPVGWNLCVMLTHQSWNSHHSADSYFFVQIYMGQTVVFLICITLAIDGSHQSKSHICSWLRASQCCTSWCTAKQVNT